MMMMITMICYTAIVVKICLERIINGKSHDTVLRSVSVGLKRKTKTN